MADLFDRYQVIDVDSHISEPADLWTSRVSKKWGDAVPHIVNEPRSGKDIWKVGGAMVLPVGTTAIAGFDGTLPECPDTMDDIPPGAHQVVVFVYNAAKEKWYEESIDVELEPGQMRTLQVVTGRAVGKRMTVTLE